MADLTINGRDIADYGVVVSLIAGWLDAPTRSYELLAVPGRAGGLVTPGGVQADAREITVQVFVPATTVTGRRTTLAALYRDLRGVVELGFGDDTSRFMYGLLKTGGTQTLGPAMVVPEAVTTLTFTIPDPVAYAATADCIAIPAGGTRVAIPTGTAPSGGIIRLAGAGTNPCVLTLRDRAGVTIQTMTLSTTWTTGEFVEVDCDAWTVKKWNGTTATNILSALGSTDTFLRFSPEDEPSLSVTGCGGATLVYRKADTV